MNNAPSTINAIREKRFNRVLFSKKSDHWATPKNLMDSLGAFDLDPCPLNGTDGLEMKWHGRVFVNPPYSDIRAWLEKGIRELQGGVREIVYLLPARTDTKWFHEIVLPFATEIQFLKGRLKFGDAKNSAPFPSMIVRFLPS